MKQLNKFLIFSAISVFIFFAVACKPSEKSVKLQTTYIPSSISNIYIGMGMKEFKNARGMENLSVTYKGNETIYKEEFTKDSITLFQYYFNKKKLSKLIVEYKNDYELYENFKTKFGEPNSGKAWLFVIDKKLSLLVWTQQYMLIIANNKQFNK